MTRYWLIVFIIFITAAPLHAQFVTIGSDQQVWVSGESLLSIKGGVENNGVVVNNGRIALSGNWRNNHIYNAGTGTFEVNGSTGQNLDHNNQSFYNLVIEGEGRKALASNADVINELIFNNGILATPFGDSLIINNDASVSGGNEGSYFEGKLFQRGTGFKFFPLGKNDHYRPVEFLDVRGIDPMFGLEMMEPNPSATLGEKLDSLSTARYWQLDRVSGSFESTPVKLSLGSDEGFGQLEGVVVAQSDSVGGTFYNIGQESATGSVEDGTVISDSLFTQKILALGITTEFSLREKILVPSAFSPSAIDPENRTVNIFGVEVSNEGFVFKIFNKWGDLVYQTTSVDEAINTGWDGNVKDSGAPATNGVYHYVLKATFESGKSIEKSGTITLFR